MHDVKNCDKANIIKGEAHLKNLECKPSKPTPSFNLPRALLTQADDIRSVKSRFGEKTSLLSALLD